MHVYQTMHESNNFSSTNMVYYRVYKKVNPLERFLTVTVIQTLLVKSYSLVPRCFYEKFIISTSVTTLTYTDQLQIEQAHKNRIAVTLQCS